MLISRAAFDQPQAITKVLVLLLAERLFPIKAHDSKVFMIKSE
jgi:hypothetical protein